MAKRCVAIFQFSDLNQRFFPLTNTVEFLPVFVYSETGGSEGSATFCHHTEVDAVENTSGEVEMYF